MRFQKPARNGAVARVAVTAVTLAAAALTVSCGGGANGNAPAVVLISIDGFRSEYLDRYDAPHLKALASAGVRARWMQPSFPVLTFPNHYTIVTGLTPAHHGIVGNNIVDPADNLWFRMNDTAQVRSSKWWGGEPIWVTAEAQGMRAASFFWPGSEATIHGHSPTFYKHYQEQVSLTDRVDTVLAWLTRADSLRPRMITGYFSSVDHAGHDAGPGSADVRAAVLAVDSAVGRLVGGIAAAGLAGRVNLVIVADHGMAETSPQRVVLLDDYVDTANVQVVNAGAFLALNPRHGDTTGLVQSLRRAPHLAVFRGDSTPARWRYSGNARVAAVVGVPDGGWLVVTRAWSARQRTPHTGGAHGYEPADTSMHALFIASGPAFKSGVTAEPFTNIHVYELLCRVLGLRPAPNDGSLDSVRAFLR